MKLVRKLLGLKEPCVLHLCDEKKVNKVFLCLGFEQTVLKLVARTSYILHKHILSMTIIDFIVSYMYKAVISCTNELLDIYYYCFFFIWPIVTARGQGIIRSREFFFIWATKIRVFVRIQL